MIKYSGNAAIARQKNNVKTAAFWNGKTKRAAGYFLWRTHESAQEEKNTHKILRPQARLTLNQSMEAKGFS